MPIKNLTDTNSRSLDKGMPLLGRIHKGRARTDDDLKKNRPGRDLKYFRVEFEPQFQYLKPIFDEMYGPEPDVLTGVFLPGSTTDEVLETWNEEYVKSGLVHRCDGETQAAWFDRSQGRVIYNKPIACAMNCQCKPEARLMLMLRDFTRETRIAGKFMLKSHSINDANHLTQVLWTNEHMFRTLIKVPFIIQRIDTVKPVPEIKNGQPTGNRIPTTMSLINMRVDEQMLPPDEMLVFRATENARALEANVPEPDAPRQLVATVPEPDKLGPQWTKADIETFVRMYREKTFTDKQVLGALKVERFMQWQGSLEQAITALEQWHNKQLGEVE